VCGISGFLDTARHRGHDELHAIVSTMADTLHHRGPDDSGTWVDAAAGVAVGQRRLSVVDRSPEGHQPMLSPRYT
jgi:asparagine synthase (glutamine-hydrolysing)